MAQRFLDREGILIVALSGLSFAFLVAAGLSLWNPPAEEPATPAQTRIEHPPARQTHDSTTAPTARQTEFVMPGEDGTSVLDLLKRRHEVKLDSELLIFGSIVLAIDSVEARTDQVWMYFRDSIPGSQSPDACTTLSGETIRWVLKQRR